MGCGITSHQVSLVVVKTLFPHKKSLLRLGETCQHESVGGRRHPGDNDDDDDDDDNDDMTRSPSPSAPPVAASSRCPPTTSSPVTVTGTPSSSPSATPSPLFSQVNFCKTY